MCPEIILYSSSLFMLRLHKNEQRQIFLCGKYLVSLKDIVQNVFKQSIVSMAAWVNHMNELCMCLNCIHKQYFNTLVTVALHSNSLKSGN
jgi:hypothetical protein